MNIFTKIKSLFTKKKSHESLQMWDQLSDPEFHPSLDLDAQYAMSLSQKERDSYLYDLMIRRRDAHEADLNE